ncbi:15308_t:CDS:2 [Cetraspora pellucida]|uniref:15308_t:CDS:1 n=1 Tax=Cetraspora pellucida TaxID=1433469 RepID=A0A9N9DLB8_9GLOM|nr:15308_t:CDS:2 [Cetraspora pellucida]
MFIFKDFQKPNKKEIIQKCKKAKYLLEQLILHKVIQYKIKLK